MPIVIEKGKMQESRKTRGKCGQIEKRAGRLARGTPWALPV